MWYSSSNPAVKYLRGMMLWLHLSVPLGWCRTCWSFWTNWRNRLRAPRSKGLYCTLNYKSHKNNHTIISIKEKHKKAYIYYIGCILTWSFRVTVAILAPLDHLGQKVKDTPDQWWVYSSRAQSTTYFTRLSPMLKLFVSCRVLLDLQVFLESLDLRALASLDQR